MVDFVTLGYTVAAGTIILCACVIAFGLAVKKQLPEIAPRCASRPPEVIYNPTPSDQCQDRGNPYLGWIRWCMSLSYETLLTGVPGTGTRNGGLEGQMLKINLDQIVLLRYHAILLRVAFVSTATCLLLNLPLYSTAQCPEKDSEASSNWCRATLNLTDFDATTLANIPLLDSTICGSATGWEVFVGGSCNRLRVRLAFVVICSWVVYYYCCFLLRKEWIYLLQMRRAYYLEADSWEIRKAELQGTMLTASSNDLSEDEEKCRDPWLPHPESWDTVANIELYSVLVGHFPSPFEEESDKEQNSSRTQRQQLEWHLNAVTSFFDYCVPNMPGYSSSIAAVTMLPSASELASTRKSWRAAASATRKLKFIRHLISNREDVGISKRSRDRKKEKVGRGGALRRSIYRSSVRNQDYFREVVGATEDIARESAIFDFVNTFGPEQASAYSIELARYSSGLCPNGNEWGLRRASTERLYELEQEAIEDVKEANIDLRAAHKEIVCTQVDSDSSNGKQFEDNDVEAAAPEGNKESKTEVSEPDADTSSRNNISSESLGRTSSALRPEISGEWKLPEEFLRKRLHLARESIKAPSVPRIFSKAKKTSAVIGRTVLRDYLISSAKKTKSIVKDLVAESSYAVVTFTSRQAAVAARQCLLDGRGMDQWLPLERLPVPPLADTPSSSFPCGPVTLSISRRQKRFRKYMVLSALACFSIFYLVIFTFVQDLVDPSSTIWKKLYKPPKGGKPIELSNLVDAIVTGVLPGIVLTILFALLPQLFRILANFGSNASSLVESEYSSMQYYWYFMSLAAFWGGNMGTIVLELLKETGSGDNELLKAALKNLADSVPTVTSALWINWITIRVFVSLPLNYLVFIPNHLFKCLRMHCLRRLTMGGGAGGPTPYRIYIDSGVVFLALVALAPIAPVLAPYALVNFLIMQPLLRRNLVFAYRPRIDSGGIRWTFLSDLIISCLYTSQILLSICLLLKRAFLPAILSAIAIIPTYIFNSELRLQFLRPYEDAALLQTSLLDGWDNLQGSDTAKYREEFRNYLVDAHKAAYIPACLVCADSSSMTLTPASVVIDTTEDNSESAQTEWLQNPRSRMMNKLTLTKRSGGIGGSIKDQNGEIFSHIEEENVCIETNEKESPNLTIETVKDERTKEN